MIIVTRNNTHYNVCILLQVNHTYYKTVVVNGGEADNLWIDLDAMAAAHGGTKKTPDALSDSHRTASVCIIHFFSFAFTDDYCI